MLQILLCVLAAVVLVPVALLFVQVRMAMPPGGRHSERRPADVVIIVDPDCQLEPCAIDWLARLCSRTERPVQALYLMRSPEEAPLRTRIAEFAWIVRNHVRPLGYHRLGLPCR